MRMKLISRDALDKRMDSKGFSNRRLAKYAECAPGTIDNLRRGATECLNKPRVAELICEALDVPLDVFFMPFASSDTGQTIKSRRAA